MKCSLGKVRLVYLLVSVLYLHAMDSGLFDQGFEAANDPEGRTLGILGLGGKSPRFVVRHFD